MVRAYIYSRRGKPSDTLELKDKYDVPALKDDQIRVKVAAVGLNPVDWKLMKYLPGFIGKRPAVAASDYSGTVLESKSDLFKAGDEVYGIVHSSVKIATGLGSLAEEIVAPANACAHRPKNINQVTAGGLSLVGLTAVVLARHADQSAERTSSEGRQRRVLVCGGASSVGMSLISILHDRGYHVSATCSKSKDQLVRDRGADITFDYRQAGMTSRLIEHVKEHGSFDSILDCADAFDVWQTSGKTLNSAGSYTNVGMDLTQGVVPALRKLVSYFLRPAWLGGVPRAYSRPKEIATRQNMDELSDFIDRGVITPLVDSEYEFEKAVDAFERLMSNKATGKVIIRVGN